MDEVPLVTIEDALCSVRKVASALSWDVDIIKRVDLKRRGVGSYPAMWNVTLYQNYSADLSIERKIRVNAQTGVVVLLPTSANPPLRYAYGILPSIRCLVARLMELNTSANRWLAHKLNRSNSRD